jgi:transposase
MLTRDEGAHAHALRRQGWTISAIARSLARDRKTIRAYLRGERFPGCRRRVPDAFVPFLAYCRQRLSGNPHVSSATVFREVVQLGYRGAYSTFTRALRRYQVRPDSQRPLTIVALLTTSKAAQSSPQLPRNDAAPIQRNR